MIRILLSHIFIILLCLVLKILNINDSAIGLSFVLLSSFATSICVLCLADLDKKIKFMILAGFLLRIALVVIDVFVTRLPDTGTDDDGFYNASLNIFESNFSNFFQASYGGTFSRLLSIIYFFIGTSRFAIQYVNTLIFVISIITLVKALNNFSISREKINIVTLFICFMPNSLLINSILRRETIIELTICASIYFFSKWAKDFKKSHGVLAVICVLLASLFHAAFIFAIPVLLMYFALYDRKKGAISISALKISKMIIFLICAVVVCVGALSMGGNKFSSVDSMEDVYSAANRARGGSVYLEGYKVNNFGQLVLFTPIKLIYFLLSPLPWMFRNVTDAISFVLDAMVYLVLLIKIMHSNKESVSRLMLCVYIILATIFALGTFNSGTAIRHRFSLLPFLLVSYATINEKRVNLKKKDIMLAKNTSGKKE